MAGRVRVGLACRAVIVAVMALLALLPGSVQAACPNAPTGYILLPDLQLVVPGADPAKSACASVMPRAALAAVACDATPNCLAFTITNNGTSGRGCYRDASQGPWTGATRAGVCTYRRECPSPPLGFKLFPNLRSPGNDLQCWPSGTFPSFRSLADRLVGTTTAMPLPSFAGATAFELSSSKLAAGCVKTRLSRPLQPALGACTYERIAEPGCGRSLGWCEHSTAQVGALDCDGDDVMDWVCTDGVANAGLRLSSQNCSVQWPNAPRTACAAFPGFRPNGNCTLAFAFRLTSAGVSPAPSQRIADPAFPAPALSALECQARCQRNAECRTFSFQQSPGGGGGSCFLYRSTFEGGAADDGFASGTCEPVLKAQCISMTATRAYGGTFVTGTVLDHINVAVPYPYPSASYLDCQTRCATNPECLKFVWAGSNVCFLFRGAFDGAVQDSFFASGVCERAGEDRCVELPYTVLAGGGFVKGTLDDNLKLQRTYPIPTRTAKECRERCRDLEACLSFVWSAASGCTLLKTGFLGVGAANLSYTSGLCASLNERDFVSCNHSPGRRFYGGGFVNGVPEDRIAAPTYPLRGVRSADECQGLCRDQPQCRTFVFSRRAGTCALHRTGFAGAAPDESFSSGSCKANKEGVPRILAAVGGDGVAEVVFEFRPGKSVAPAFLAEAVPLECPAGTRAADCPAFLRANTKQAGPFQGTADGKCQVLSAEDVPIRPGCVSGTLQPQRVARRCIRLTGLRRDWLYQVTVRGAWGGLLRGASDGDLPMMSARSEPKLVTTSSSLDAGASPGHGNLTARGVREALAGLLSYTLSPGDALLQVRAAQAAARVRQMGDVGLAEWGLFRAVGWVTPQTLPAYLRAWGSSRTPTWRGVTAVGAWGTPPRASPDFSWPRFPPGVTASDALSWATENLFSGKQGPVETAALYKLGPLATVILDVIYKASEPIAWKGEVRTAVQDVFLARWAGVPMHGQSRFTSLAQFQALALVQAALGMANNAYDSLDAGLDDTIIC